MGESSMENMKKEVLIIVLMVFALVFAGAVSAHPGHGTPQVVTSDDTASSSQSTSSPTQSTTSSTSQSSTTSSSSSSQSSSPSQSSSSSQSSSGSSVTGTSSASNGVNSAQSGTSATNWGGKAQDAENVSTTQNGLEKTLGISYNSPGGPAALVGLMIISGLIAFNFPFKGGFLASLQENIFKR